MIPQKYIAIVYLLGVINADAIYFCKLSNLFFYMLIHEYNLLYFFGYDSTKRITRNEGINNVTPNFLFF